MSNTNLKQILENFQDLENFSLQELLSQILNLLALLERKYLVEHGADVSKADERCSN